MTRYWLVSIAIVGVIAVLASGFLGHRQSGNQFAQELIKKSLAGDGEVYVGDPSKIETRVCFAPSDRFEALKSNFPNIPVVYWATDDSNRWYIAKYSKRDHGLIILGVDHSVLRWNDENATATTPVDELNFDENADTVCASKVKVYFWGKDRIPTFRPVYSSTWRK